MPSSGKTKMTTNGLRSARRPCFLDTVSIGIVCCIVQEKRYARRS